MNRRRLKTKVMAVTISALVVGGSLGTAAVFAAEKAPSDNQTNPAGYEMNMDEKSFDGFNFQQQGPGASNFHPQGMMKFSFNEENGERPELSEGEMPQMPEGEMPQLPEGGMPGEMNGERPELPEGEMPQMPEGGMPGEMNGERPEFPEGEMNGERPELPEGEMNGERPELPEGEMPQLPMGRSPMMRRPMMNGNKMDFMPEVPGQESEKPVAIEDFASSDAEK